MQYWLRVATGISRGLVLQQVHILHQRYWTQIVVHWSERYLGGSSQVLQPFWGLDSATETYKKPFIFIAVSGEFKDWLHKYIISIQQTQQDILIPYLQTLIALPWCELDTRFWTLN